MMLKQQRRTGRATPHADKRRRLGVFLSCSVAIARLRRSSSCEQKLTVFTRFPRQNHPPEEHPSDKRQPKSRDLEEVSKINTTWLGGGAQTIVNVDNAVISYRRDYLNRCTVFTVSKKHFRLDKQRRSSTPPRLNNGSQKSSVETKQCTNDCTITYTIKILSVKCTHHNQIKHPLTHQCNGIVPLPSPPFL